MRKVRLAEDRLRPGAARGAYARLIRGRDATAMVRVGDLLRTPDGALVLRPSWDAPAFGPLWDEACASQAPQPGQHIVAFAVHDGPGLTEIARVGLSPAVLRGLHTDDRYAPRRR